jgi:hypothetical protein
MAVAMGAPTRRLVAISDRQPGFDRGWSRCRRSGPAATPSPDYTTRVADADSLAEARRLGLRGLDPRQGRRRPGGGAPEAGTVGPPGASNKTNGFRFLRFTSILLAWLRRANR